MSPTIASHSIAFGRRPPKRATALSLGPMLTGAIPSAPAHVDYGTRFRGWKMLGNDVAGDCVAVTWANQRVLVTAALSGKPQYPDQAKVWAFYKTQNPDFDPNGSSATNGPGSAADNGMDIQTALERLRSVGGPDGVKAVAFAQVDYTDEAELRAAHAIFGQVWYGIWVQQANDDEYYAGQPWDYVPNSPYEGGHSVTGVGYDPTDYRFITWAEETMWTEGFRTHLVDEAWVVIWPEHFGSTQFQQGINLTKLAADFQAITGDPLPIPPRPIAPTSAVATGPNRLDAFVRAADGRLWHEPWDGQHWGPFRDLGSDVVGEPSVCSWGPGRLDVFGLSTSHAVVHQGFEGTGWGGWQNLGGNLVAPPVAMSWGNRRLDLFGLGPDHAVWHKAYDRTAWTGWRSIGGNLVAPPTVVSWAPGRVDVFGLGTDHAVWHRAWTGTAWTGWQNLGGTLVAPPAAVSWGDQRLDLFGRGSDNAVWHRAWNGAGWGGWQSLGGHLAAPPTAVAWGTKRLDVFGLGTDHTVSHRAYGGTGWSSWGTIGGNLAGPPTAVARSINRLDVFGHDRTAGLVHRAWTGAAWTPWQNLGGPAV